MTPIAHVREPAPGSCESHDLAEHLEGVAPIAESLAASFDSGGWSNPAGLWHDLGKYQPASQQRIRAASGMDAHIEAPCRVRHAIAGAVDCLGATGQLQGPLGA